MSGSFERFFMIRGERVVRVVTKLTSDARRGGRECGKSDRIDALGRAKGWMGCRRRSWPAWSSTSVCSSITANG